LGPEDIDGNYDVDVLIATADPINDIAKQNHFANMRDRKFVSHRTALELAGFEDPEEEQDLLAFEEVMDSPLGRQWTLEHMFARMGQSVSPEQAGEAAQAVLQAGGVTPEVGGQFGGRPPGQQQVPGLGAPTVGPANQPGPGQVPVGR
jgi:hypothetical protein